MAPYQCAAGDIGCRGDLFDGMVAGIMESGVQNIAGSIHIIVGDPQFKLSTFAAFNVPGICCLGCKISADGVVFDMDMVHPAY